MDKENKTSIEIKDYEVAEELGSKMKAVSVAEFFKKNRHLLGFDSPSKSLLMVIKEAVDNSLDATEDLGYNMKAKGEKVLPEITVEVRKAEYGLSIFHPDTQEHVADLTNTDKNWEISILGKKLRASKVENNIKTYNIEGMKVDMIITDNIKPTIMINGKKGIVEERTLKYNIVVLDNGPGIIEKNIPFAFGKLLYGSKFHRLRQSRGQQGIGISAAVLYAQQTTGIPAKIVSKIGKNKKAVGMLITIADNNEPIIHERWETDDFPYDHGTRFEVTIEGEYIAKGEKSVYEFIRRTSIVNPHAEFIFITPDKEKIRFKRTSNELPEEPKEIKPHPYGLELGTMQTMLKNTTARTIRSFLINDLSRISPSIADSILSKVEIDPNKKPEEITTHEIEKIIRAFTKENIQRPPTDCLSPIGEEALRKSILQDTKAEFIATISRKPSVYNGRPFLVEAAIAFGGEIKNEGVCEKLRFANKIPLLYDSAGCAITKAIQDVSWKQYGVQNVATNGTPMGPYIILLHLASVWVPYMSEGKSAIANYDEIIKEMKLALQDCARKLKNFLSAKYKAERQAERRSLFEIYIPELAFTLSEITEVKEEKIKENLKKIINKGNIQDEELEEENENKSQKDESENIEEGEEQ